MKNKQSDIPDQHQRDVIENELDVNLLVEAAAGTGKTTSLISRMIALIRKGKCQIDEMAAVTFTRKAASEMRSRFQIAMEKTLRTSAGIEHDRTMQALDQIDRCFIGTIHSFCGRLLRERPVEAGVDIAFREIDEIEDDLIRQSVWEEYAAKLHASDDPLLDELNEAGLGIRNLGSAFKNMADYPDVEEWPAPQATLNRLVSVKFALLEYADHMETLLPTLPRDAGSDQLIPQYKRIPRLVRYYNLDNAAQLMEVLQEFKKVRITQKCWPGNKDQAMEEKNRWDRFVEQHAAPLRRQWLARRYNICIRTILPAFKLYEGKKRRLGVLNFQDLLVKSAQALKNHAQVRSYFQKRITHLLVDEFQDTDPIQAEVMMLLTSDDDSENDWRLCRPRPGALFVVGDPKQSIYRFRRADIVTYNLVRKIIVDHGGDVIQLSSNFRTDPVILNWVNQTFAAEFPSEESSYSPTYVHLQYGKPCEDISSKEKIQRLYIPGDDSKKNEDCLVYEADWIAKTIQDLIASGRARAGDFMIVAYLTRNLSLYADLLQQRQIPCQVTGGDALNQAEEMRLLALCLSAIVRTDDPIALVSALRSELFGFSDPALYEYKKKGGVFSYLASIPEGLSPEIHELFEDAFARFRKYRGWIKGRPASTAIDQIADDLGLYTYASAHRDGNLRCGSLAKAVDKIRSMQEDFLTFGDILDFFDQLIRNEMKMDGLSACPPDPSVVRIMNLHKVKGLEAPIVFLADPTGHHNHAAQMHIDRSEGCVKGFLSIEKRGAASWGNSEILAQPMEWDELAEEEQRYIDAEKTRLLYVAATRCKKQILITQREKSNKNNPWQFFEPALSNKPTLRAPAERPIDATAPQSISSYGLEKHLEGMHESRDFIQIPTYAVLSVKEQLRGYDEDYPTREEGTIWGEVIHALLEMRIKNPGGDLMQSAAILTQTHYGRPEWTEKAVQVVRSVESSDLWRRALASPHCLAEVPFEIRSRTAGRSDIPVIERGVIDLVFQESGDWIIVDYKTDLAARDHLETLVRKYRPQIDSYAEAWRHITQKPVREAGLYFTEIQKYVTE
ncbi:MAG: UvrD-helicase domain-containing protein [Candidatus Omnitrophica bacterium]|nr:UvrD-helicase domain-containing protein [Candidatus Omnitrophota bacterium]